MGDRLQTVGAEDGDRHVYSVEFSQTLTPTVAVLEAVADAKDVDPTTMPEIYDVVEADALNAMLTAEEGSPIRVDFEYADCDVTISAAGEVFVEPDR